MSECQHCVTVVLQNGLLVYVSLQMAGNVLSGNESHRNTVSLLCSVKGFKPPSKDGPVPASQEPEWPTGYD